MHPSSKRIQTVYLALLLINTLASSMIWGINTIFLLDAGLNNAQAFLANAFFTIGQVFFEVPTGIVADVKGRRFSYLLGTITLSLSTLAYLGAWWWQLPFWTWAASSVLLGLGFTFFSGATEAWLVDALEAAKFEGSLDGVFAKGQMIGGVAMLVGSVSGGFIAQVTSLGVPYLLRAGLLGLNFLIAFLFMKDWGFEPVKSTHLGKDVKNLFQTSFKLGLGNPPVRWLMLAAPFTSGVGFYVFYAMQPYLLQLYHNDKAYGIAGLAAAIVAGAQIAGGLLVPKIGKVFQRRTTALATVTSITVLLFILTGVINNFWVAIGLLSVWALISASVQPVRQAYLNGLIPSKQRATVISFDSFMASSGGVVIQPILGRVADAYSYSSSLLVAAAFQAIAVPFTLLAWKERAESDPIEA